MRKYMTAIGLSFAIALAIPVMAHAKGCKMTNDGKYICNGGEAIVSHTLVKHRTSNRQVASNVTIIGGRPAGCPHAYCGCGLRKYLGLSDTRLNLAWNWAKLFPRTSLRAGVAAVRHGHVMYVIKPLGGSKALVRDYNSGGGLSRIHVRSVSGYVFVEPGARRADL